MKSLYVYNAKLNLKNAYNMNSTVELKYFFFLFDFVVEDKMIRNVVYISMTVCIVLNIYDALLNIAEVEIEEEDYIAAIS